VLVRSLPRRQHALVLALVALCGALVFLLGLGHSGLVDETPAVFAATARRMASSGDWLIPQVNGLPRYDKPPLVTWLMAFFYALPGHARWDPLGSWAARLPSALASIATMLLLADTLLRWPQQGGAAPTPSGARGLQPEPWIGALSAALAFALGPWMLVWGRSEVSDALFTATLTLALLLAWRTYAAPSGPWWPCWGALALAVLTKGPVALLLLPLTLICFSGLGAEVGRLRRRLRPLAGLPLSLGLAAPWFALALLREGRPYWESFFGYHNLQRYTRVVNNHQQGPAYFLLVLLLASLPFTPLLLAQLQRTLRAARTPLAPAVSLGRFAAAWLLVVLGFFSLSATKLPSYWLVATPAAALLVALAAGLGLDADGSRGRCASRPGPALRSSALLLLLLGAALVCAPLWLPLIQDPSLPDLAAVLQQRPWWLLGAGVCLAAALPLWLPCRGGAPPMVPLARLAQAHPAGRLLGSQLLLLLLVPLVLLPLWQLGDQLRGAPIRQLAAVVRAQGSGAEPLAMVGLMKPSLHFYSQRTVLYEGRSPQALVNLAERLGQERRPGLQPASAQQQATLLLVIDGETVGRPSWRGWAGRELARFGPYRLLRLERAWLERRARELRASGHEATWQMPRPERY